MGALEGRKGKTCMEHKTSPTAVAAAPDVHSLAATAVERAAVVVPASRSPPPLATSNGSQCRQSCGARTESERENWRATGSVICHLHCGAPHESSAPLQLGRLVPAPSEGLAPGARASIATNHVSGCCAFGDDQSKCLPNQVSLDQIYSNAQ